MSDTLNSGLEALTDFMGGWRFPAFTVAFLVGATVLLGATLLIPPSSTPLSAFAEEFKTWCFGYDPATGELEWAYVLMLLVNPTILVSVIVGGWWEPLGEMWTHHRRFGLRWAAAGLALVIGAAGGLGMIWQNEPATLEFPAKALRTHHTPPDFTFVDQEGKTLRLGELQNRVIIITGVYATCGYTCPTILAQAKRVIAAVPPEVRDNITVVGITLDPEKDTSAELKKMAEAQSVKSPRFRLVTGQSEEVNRVLDVLNFARKRNPETGVIDHANLFLVVDPGGRIAYRFTLGERQEQWLTQAVLLLAGEVEPER